MPKYESSHASYIGVRLPDAMLAGIEKETGRRGLSEFVRQALAEKLARVEGARESAVT